MPGLIKTTLALYHTTLPPTLNYKTPNPRLELEKTPFYINTETRPWIHGLAQTPSAGRGKCFRVRWHQRPCHFRGISHTKEAALPSHLLHWETEVCIFQGGTRQDLAEQMLRSSDIWKGAPSILEGFAYTLNMELAQLYRVAIVATSLDDSGKKLEHTLQRLSDPRRTQIKDREGIYYL